MAVVGGGILGASTAAALARQGAKVTLFTEGGFCSGASGRSSAWLNSHDRWSAEYRNLRLLGLDHYRTFEQPDVDMARRRASGSTAVSRGTHRASSRTVGKPSSTCGESGTQHSGCLPKGCQS